MTTLLPVEKMTRQQKVRAINELWASLAATGDKLPSPAWHKDELAKRATKARAGQVVWTDWAVAKERLRNKLHPTSARVYI